MYLPLVTWLTGIRSRALLLPALHPWRAPYRRVSGDGMRVEPSLMHPEGGSWTRVRTHTPSKFSKVRTAPLAPIPLDHSKFRENGSQPPSNRTGGFHRIRLSPFGRSPRISKRSFAFPELHGRPSMDSLRVRSVPLLRSFQRLGAFAFSPRPGAHGFPVFRLLCPFRLPMKASEFHTALAFLLPPSLPSFMRSPVFPM